MITLSKNLPGNLLPVGSEVKLKLSSPDYITNIGSLPFAIIRVEAPTLTQGIITLNIGDLNFTLYVDFSQSGADVSPTNTIYSGYGTVFNPTTFAALWKARFETIPFIYKNFDVTIHIIGENYFSLKLTGRIKGDTIASTAELLPFVSITTTSNGVALQVKENYLYNLEVSVAKANSNTYEKIVSLYAYPIINGSNGEGFIDDLNKYLYKKIMYDLFNKLTEFYQLPDFDAALNLTRKVKLCYWASWGFPAVDQPIQTDLFWSFAGGIHASQMLGYTQASMLHKWLSHRPNIRYLNRNQIDFVSYFTTLASDIGVYIDAYRSSTLIATIPNSQPPYYEFDLKHYQIGFSALGLEDYDYGDGITHYKLQMRNNTTLVDVGEPLTVILTDTNTEKGEDFNEHTLQLVYLNSYRCLETMIVNVPIEKQIKVTGDELERKRTFSQVNYEVYPEFTQEEPDVRNVFKCNTGYIGGKDEAIAAEELLKSPHHLLMVPGGRRFFINMKRDTFKVWNESEIQTNVSFEFTIAQDGKFYDEW